MPTSNSSPLTIAVQALILAVFSIASAFVLGLGLGVLVSAFECGWRCAR